jgi:SAM-dependent methyltransferase
VVTRRAELGQWNTAGPVAQLAIAALGGIAPHARVIDPTCGDGGFLAAAIAVGARRIVGIEIDDATAQRARERLDIGAPSADIDARIIVSDVLAPDLVERLGLFDIAIGNPPYVRAGRVDPAIKRERARVLAADWPALDPALIDAIARHADVAATCLLRTLRFVRPGGHLALVVSSALLDADGAAAVWDAVAHIADVEALISAPGERWFADAAVNPMLLVARRHSNPRTTSAESNPRTTSAESNPRATSAESSAPRILRLSMPTRELVATTHSLDDIAHACEERSVETTTGPTSQRPAGGHVPTGTTGSERAATSIGAWATALRAPSVWFAWRERAGDMLVPLRELCDVRRGLTTGANDVFYVTRDQATRLRLESRYLAPVVRSPFNGAPAPIAIAPDESPLVAIAVPADAKLAKAPRIAAWFARHEAATLQTSAARRDPWWSLPVKTARLFFAKAYGPRFVQRLADLPMLGDQRVYALHPKSGVDLGALAAVLNSLPTALALESAGRRSMGYGAIEWTVHDAMELPVLDVRRASKTATVEMFAALEAIARRPVGHVRLEREEAGRARLDRAVMTLAPGGELAEVMWDGLCASVAQRDRYLLPAV